ncbi:MAG: putative rane protein [Clostridiales bacterium]|nr:putative rane protein [Clostridiales bacterium]
MNRNRINKIVAVVGLSMAMASSQILAGTPAMIKAAQVSKEENVYVNLDANGSTSDVTVSDWIKNVALASALKDKSELTGIENVKGDETFTQDGDNLTWAANNEDIYYQGKIDKELPITMNITYKLDGTQIEPKDLVGKSGKVEIHIEYQNHAKTTETVDGKAMDVYVPFAMITGVILPTDKFKNVEVDNGKIMSDADKQIVVGYALPGLEESLDLDSDIEEDLNIPSSVTISADATDFELGGTYTLATSEFMTDFSLGSMDKVDDLKDSLDDLADASGKLVDGTSDLAEGVGTLKDKSGQFTDGIDTLSNGLTKLNTGAKSLETGVKAYTNGADQLAAGIQKLKTAISSLPEKLGELVTGLTSAKQGTDQLVASTEQLEKGMESVNGGIDTMSATLSQVSTLLSSVDGASTDPKIQKAIATINALAETTGEEGTLKAGADAVENGLGKLNEGQKSLQTGIGTMQEGVSALAGDSSSTTSLSTALEQLSQGADQLSQNGDSLVKGAKGIADATTQLKAGGDKLDDGAEALSDGIDKLNDGSIKLRDNMKKFDKEGIEKLYDAINEDIADMFDRLDAISQAGQDYNSFSGIDNSMDGSVRFIMETSEIK